MISCILQFFIQKKISAPLNFNFVLQDAVSLDVLYLNFRENQLVSNSSVDNIKKISVHEDVCLSLFRKVGKKLSGDTASHQSSKILNAVDYIRD